MIVHEFRAGLDLKSLEGATVDAYAQDDGYWHLFVALRLIANGSVIFTTKEHSAGPRFEVFPIQSQREVADEREWRALPAPLLIGKVTPLWRSEWVEPGAVGEALGSSPATQYAGRGPVPATAATAAYVQAGVLLQGRSGAKW